MTYAERFPNLAKIENPVIRAYYYSLEHAWVILKREFPPNPANMPPNVQEVLKRMSYYAGNTEERMFLFPVGDAKCVYRDPETGIEEPIEDPWAEFEDWIENATYVAAVNHCVCRESGTGNFECGQTCYIDGLTCQVFLGEGGRTAFPETCYEISKVDLRFRVQACREKGDEILMYGYGPPDPSMHRMEPVCQAMTVGFCTATKASGYPPVWKDTIDGGVYTKQVYEIEIDPNKCVGCGSCIGSCDLNEIKYDPDSGKAYIESMKYCVGCGRCQTRCPAGAITVFTTIKDRLKYLHDNLDCRISVTADMPVYDPEVSPKVVKDIPFDLSYFEENTDVDKIYQDWKAERIKNGLPY